jgi:uncharacterized protein (TIGR02246 family)
MRLFPIFLIAAGISLAADKTVDSIKAAEKSWAAATVAGDENALGRILADDLSYTHSTGDTDTKTAFISNLKSGARKYLKVDHDSIDVRRYGNAAVVMATAHIETSQNGKAAPAHLRFLHVWILQDGRWQLAAHQSLRLPN